jgi:hypothetical protein
MTNLSDPTRYNLLGIPNTTAGNLKADNALRQAGGFPFADKKNRDLLQLQYQNLNDTLSIFAGIDFGENTSSAGPGNYYTDSETGYYLFPTTGSKNSGQVDTNSSAYTFFNNLKSAALILNKTDAIIAGTEVGGFDTHNNQRDNTSVVTGTHANLQRRIGWAMYALRKYFLDHGDKATWNNLVVVTLSEFGRTSKQNTSLGTDHAEAGAMFVAGGAVKGYNKGNPSGVFGCSGSVDTNNPIAWTTGLNGTMFGVNNNYLKRCTDYRSVLGKLIRDHLGATQPQLDRIIPGYASEPELKDGGNSTVDTTPVTGELPII